MDHSQLHKEERAVGGYSRLERPHRTEVRKTWGSNNFHSHILEAGGVETGVGGEVTRVGPGRPGSKCSSWNCRPHPEHGWWKAGSRDSLTGFLWVYFFRDRGSPIGGT